MRGFVAPTDHAWYQFLRARPEITELNFWRPTPGRFAALNEGDPFFFKLRSPHNAIGGFGLYAGFAELAIWRAWDVFGQGNGTRDEHDLLTRLSANSARAPVLSGLERVIGCIA